VREIMQKYKVEFITEDVVGLQLVIDQIIRQTAESVTISVVKNGEEPMTIEELVATLPGKPKPAQASKSQIEKRRARVLKLYNQDYEYVAIAKRLKLKPTTVYNDITALRKLGEIR
jgi:DNA-binding NarL/FixJ family response regulator